MSDKTRGLVGVEAIAARRLERNLRAIGESQALRTFLAGYGKVRTKSLYVESLKMYFDWLREERGAALSPDDLIRANLKNIYESSAVDVLAKKQHLSWLDEYVNTYLVGLGKSESRRTVVAAAVKQFYERNDSQLFGFFKVSQGPDTLRDKPLRAADIRAVLLALPLGVRAPYLCEWQSGIEINKLLGLRWTDLGDLSVHPLKLQFSGRKRHRRPYFTFLGRDAISAIRALPRRNEFVFAGKLGPIQSAEYLGKLLKATAKRLMDQGLIEEYPLSSWRSHQLRASFETEAAHAGVKKEVRGFFEGHLGDIKWVYDNSDTLHEADLIAEYAKIEPLVSLDSDEATIRGEYETREKTLRTEFEALKADWEKMQARLRSFGIADSSNQPRP